MKNHHRCQHTLKSWTHFKAWKPKHDHSSAAVWGSTEALSICMKRSLPPGPRHLRHHPLPGRGAAVLLHSSSCFLSQPLMLSTLGLNLDHFKAWIKTDLQVSAAPIFGARGLFTTVFFNLQLWIQKEQKHVVMSCRYEPHSSAPLQATPFQICFPIRADNSNHFLYWLPSNTTAEDGHSFSKPEATDVRLIIQKLFYLTELKKTFKCYHLWINWSHCGHFAHSCTESYPRSETSAVSAFIFTYWHFTRARFTNSDCLLIVA